MNIAVGVLAFLALAAGGPACGPPAPAFEKIDALRSGGKLHEAQALASEQLVCTDRNISDQIRLHLILAWLYDRIGLHTYSRPVAAGLEHISAADQLAAAGSRSQAEVSLAYAKYYYRAEIRGREFPESERHARVALAQFEALADLRGQADAVHQLGLIHFQRRELAPSRAYFEESLALERAAGTPRLEMLADYARHMGFVEQRSGDLEAAITLYEESMRHHRRGGFKDAAMLSAITYGAALVRTGRAAAAGEPLRFALDIANRLDSPEGRAQAGLALGRYHAALGETEEALGNFELAREAAAGIGHRSIVEAAERAMTELAGRAR